jgi:hypothetical protein
MGSGHRPQIKFGAGSEPAEKLPRNCEYYSKTIFEKARYYFTKRHFFQKTFTLFQADDNLPVFHSNQQAIDTYPQDTTKKSIPTPSPLSYLVHI